jgi:hypothetical protein
MQTGTHTYGFNRFAGRSLGVATIHGKEQVIGPALMDSLSLAGFHAIVGVETDRFGSFSGEVQRTQTPLEAAIAKARHGAEVSGMDLVIASEGSFGPYPPAPFLSCDEEFLVLYDARDGQVFIHRKVFLGPVFGGEECDTLTDVKALAERLRFPSHRLVVRRAEKWRMGDVVTKGIGDIDLLHSTAEALIAAHGSCWVETDLRAMSNPTRMQAIADTAVEFAKELARTCPACGTCWFHITDTQAGLPCGLCGWPTDSIRVQVRTCRHCAHSEQETRVDGRTEEDPRYCDHCNP